jgi:hypothetical protein
MASAAAHLSKVRGKQRMRTSLLAGALLAALLAPTRPLEASVVSDWNETLLGAVRANAPRPTVVSRTLFMTSAAAYDAWASFDARALAATPANRGLRRPPIERTEANRKVAVSYAMYRVMLNAYPSERARFETQMRALGLDPDFSDAGEYSPAALGNLVASRVLAARADDGSNPQQNFADMAGPAFPVTYASVNAADPAAPNAAGGTAFNINHWQPLRVPTGTVRDAAGQPIADAARPDSFRDQTFLTPHWGSVRPFAIASASALLPPAPPKHGSQQPYVDGLGVTSTSHEAWVRQFTEVLNFSGSLDDRGKVIAEFWADGPRSETPPGHWNQLAQGVSHRDHHDIGADARMFLALNAALFDSGIATWNAKRIYDSGRPVSSIRHYFKGQMVQAWAGPNQGIRMIRGEDWMPYQESTFVTPPFGEYTSGHSGFSAAAASVLEHVTGSEVFYDGLTRIDADLNGDGQPDLLGEFIANPGYLRFETGPATPVVLRWPTFRDAADEAGLSRLYGGIHIQDGDLRGREIGRQVASQVLARVDALVSGQLPVSKELTGVWFDPARSGEGVSLQVDDVGTVVVQWSTYDNQSRQMWLAGAGRVDEEGRLRVQLNVTSGGRWGSGFDPAQVRVTEFGEVELRMLSCDRLELDYRPTLYGFEAGSINLQRLFNRNGSRCDAL